MSTVPPGPKTHLQKVPALNATFRGIKLHNNKVVQYRGIKYASIAERFALPVAVDSFFGEVVDCTKFGPICPQSDVDLHRFFFAIPEDQEVPSMDEWVQDEFECLNLIVTVPADIQEGRRLPVLVYIHGGSFVEGTANHKLEDLSTLVSNSISRNHPIITVSINYRLHLLGFSTLPHTQLSNHGVHDQRSALNWIKTHICSFSGDPSSITLSGDSSGSVSVHAHIHASRVEGLFQRAIMFSGSLGTMPVRGLKRQESVIKRVCGILGIDTGVGWEEKYKKVAVERLKEAFFELGVGALFLTDDAGWKGGFFAGEVGFDKEVVPEWCEALMVGDNNFDSYNWNTIIPFYTPSQILTSIKDSLPPGLPSAPSNIAETIIKTYNLDPPDIDSIPEGTVQKNALNFLNDVLYHWPNVCVVETWKRAASAGSADMKGKGEREKKVFQYLMDEPSPFINEFSEAHHDANLLYSFTSYTLGPPQSPPAKTSAIFQQKILDFVYRRDPWTPGKIFAFGPGGFCRQLVDGTGKEEYGKRRREREIMVLRGLGLEEEEWGRIASAIIRGKPDRFWMNIHNMPVDHEHGVEKSGNKQKGGNKEADEKVEGEKESLKPKL